MENLNLYAPWFAMVVFGFALFELIWRKKTHLGYDMKAGAASIGVAVGQLVTNALSTLIIGFLALKIYELTPFKFDMSQWWSWGLAFLIVEFIYYLFHRLSHEKRWLWATHSVHHTPNEMTFLASIRLGWTGLISGAPFFYLPAIALGFHPAVIFGLLVLNLRYQFFLHTELCPKLGFVDYVFNTPSNHRVHHASNPLYLDKNYGGILMVFDHLFGTYQKELASEPCKYGLVEPIVSYNPFIIALSAWPKLMGDIMKKKGLKEKLSYAFGYPSAEPK